MTILDSKGQVAQGTDEAIVQNALRHWMSKPGLMNLLGRLGLLPSGDALARLGNRKMDTGEAAKIFRSVVLNKKARKYIVQLGSQKQNRVLGETPRGLEAELLAMAEALKPQGHASKSGLIIP